MLTSLTILLTLIFGLSFWIDIGSLLNLLQFWVDVCSQLSSYLWLNLINKKINKKLGWLFVKVVPIFEIRPSSISKHRAKFQTTLDVKQVLINDTAMINSHPKTWYSMKGFNIEKINPIASRIFTHSSKCVKPFFLPVLISIENQTRTTVRLLKIRFICLASLCINCCISALLHGGTQPVEMWKCNGNPAEPFWSSTLLDLVSLIFVRSGDFADQLRTVIPLILNELLQTLWLWFVNEM